MTDPSSLDARVRAACEALRSGTADPNAAADLVEQLTRDLRITRAFYKATLAEVRYLRAKMKTLEGT